jgi:LPS-assembly lipoprotein
MTLLRWVPLVLAVSLSACGFRLEGSGTLPPEFSQTYIQAEDRYTPFYQNLTGSLRQRGVTIAKSPASAGAIINVISDSSGKDVTAVSSRNTPLEYQAYYRVNYSVTVGPTTVLEPATISLVNRYDFDETKVLGKEEEFDMLVASQARDISRQILIQLSKL